MVTTSLYLLAACTTGKLYYTDQSGKRVLGCDVEYALSLCAKSAVKKGHQLDSEQIYLLELSTSIPDPPCGKLWDHEIAKTEYKSGKLSKKQYGYIVAYIDMGLTKDAKNSDC